MNYCETRNILCPYALSDIGRVASLPCIATQKQCDNWREEVKNEKA